MKEGKKKNFFSYIFSSLVSSCKKIIFFEKIFQMNFSPLEWIKNGKEVQLIDRIEINKCFKVISGE